MLTLLNALNDVMRTDVMRTDPWFTPVVSGAPAAVWPMVDVMENGEAYLITAELAGVKLEDVKLEIEGDLLTLSAAKRREAAGEGTALHHVERRYGSFTRSFRLPKFVDWQAVNAEMKDGVLTITLPKAEAARPRQIRIQVAEPKGSGVRQIEGTGEAASAK